MLLGHYGEIFETKRNSDTSKLHVPHEGPQNQFFRHTVLHVDY